MIRIQHAFSRIVVLLVVAVLVMDLSIVIGLEMMKFVSLDPGFCPPNNQEMASEAN